MFKMNKAKHKKLMAATRHRQNKLCGLPVIPRFVTTENLWLGVLVCLLASVYIASDNNSSNHHDEIVSSSSSSSIPINKNNNNNNINNNNKQHSQYVAHIHNLLAANEPSLALQQVVEGQGIYKDSIKLTMLLGISHATLNQCPEAIQVYSRALNLISKQEEKQQQPTSSPSATAADDDDDDSWNDIISSNDRKDYKIKAMTWIGVCHRRMGNAQQAIQWLEASVAKDSGSNRESRHQLAHSYLAQSRYLDSAEQLAVIFQNTKKTKTITQDADYYLLSIILSTMEQWQLLAQSLHHCLAHDCSLSTATYPAAQIYVEYAVALEQCGRLEESLTQQQKAADFLAPTLSSKQGDDDGNNNNSIMVRVLEMGNAYLQSARQRTLQQRSELLTPEDQEKWQSVVQMLWISTAHSPTAWSIIKHRHVQGFNYPIPNDLVQQVYQEIKDDQESSSLDMMALYNNHNQTRTNSILTTESSSYATTVPTFTTLPNRTTPCVNHYTCLQLSIYTLENCIFYAQVQSARLQQQLINTQQNQEKRSSSSSSIDVMTYSEFPRNVDPQLGPTTQLHVGIYTADLRPHPMLPLIRTFLKYTSSTSSLRHHHHDDENLLIKVTLYHTAADPDILKEMKQYVNEIVACTREAWQDCVKHARQHKVHVWLETTGRTGDGIPSIAASGPAPVGVIWAGFPGSMGMPSTLQYMVTDRYTVPPPHDGAVLQDINNDNNTTINNIAALYPEKMIYVPGSWMIADPSIQDKESSRMQNRTTNEIIMTRRRRELREKYQIPIDAFVYGYFGRLWKLDDNVFATWCSIIERVPGSMLLMLDYHDGNADANGAMARIRKQFSNHRGGGGGLLDESRLIVLPPFDRGQHVAAQAALVDVSLDSVSYSGGATALDAILAQRPLVHCPGGFKMTQRSAGSVLTAAGLADVLVGKDLQEYNEIAVRLGLDKAFYKQVQQRVVNDINHSVLFQPQIGIEAMVFGMRQAYNLWRTGHGPQTIFVDRETRGPQPVQVKDFDPRLLVHSDEL